MPTTNRPFFFNFLAAFRTQSALQKASTTSPSVLAPATYNATNSPVSPTSVSSPRPITTKSGSHHIPYETTVQAPHTTNPATVAAAHAAAATFRSSRPVGPPSSSVGTAPARAHSATRLPHHPTPPVSLPPGSHSSTAAYNDGCWSPVGVSPPSPFQARSRTPSLTRKTTRQRRGSDSSSEGGWGVAGAGGGLGKSDAGLGAAADKWYIGGRAANGEERFYKLGLVRRYESADRLSLDRLSL